MCVEFPLRLVNDLPLSAGTLLGRYEIRSHLGAGGMGEVYLGHDSQLDRHVALKLLPSDLTRDDDRLRRFVQEAKAASALNHPNIVTIYEIGESEAGRYMAMEFVDGKTLRDLAASSPLSLDSITDVTSQIAKALNVAHTVGIVHRDIKPENVMVRNDGYVKVLDFGLARLVPGGTALSDAETLAPGSGGATEPGMILGTLRYMSPEQTRGERVSTATDIFSLGIVLYELTAGRHPFSSDSHIGMMHAIMTQPVIAPNRLNPAIPSALEALILRMLHKDAALRPTAAEIDAALSKSTSPGVGTEIKQAISSKHNRVGHDRDRAELRKNFAAIESGAGSMLCLAGEPGIGKTTLVEDFLTELTSNGDNCLVGRGRCSERLAGTEAYLPLLEALESLMHGTGGDSRVQMMRLLAPTWYVQIAPFTNDSSANRAQTDLKTASKDWMKRELAGFLTELSQHQPLVLFLDDLHWSDTSTVELLAYLADRLDTMRLLILTTYRSSELLLVKHPFLQIKLDLQARGICRELALGFLTREDIDHYLQLEFPGHQFPGELATLIHSKTEGSPLFMADLVQYLRDRKVISHTDGIWILSQSVPDVEGELPESVRSMIQRKIEQLTDDDRKLLMAASVQGYEFDSAVLADVLEIEADEIEDRLETLERVHSFVQLIDEREFPDLTLTLRYRFVHVLYQNVLYSSIRPTRKASLSRSIANALLSHYQQQSSEIVSELAFLFKSGRDFRQAADCFLLAGTNAARVYANQEAIIFYEAAAEMAELQQRGQRDPSRESCVAATKAYESLGNILSITGRHEEARVAFGKALSYAGEDYLSHARVNRGIAGSWQAQRQTAEALKALDAAENDLSKESGEQKSQAWWHEFLQVQLERMWVFYWLAEIEHLNELTTAMRPFFEQHGTQTQRAKFFHMLMLYHLRRDRYAPKEETVKYAEAGLLAIEGSDDVGELTAIRFGNAFVSLWLGNLDVAEEHLTGALQIARRRGDSLNQVLSLSYLTIVHRKRGNLEKVREYNLQAMEAASAARMIPYIALARANLAWIAWREGDHDRAKADAAAALDSWQQDQGSYPFQWAAIWLLVSLSMLQERVSEAIKYARLLFGPTQQQLPSKLSSLTEEAIAHWQRGDTDTARAHLNEALKLAEELQYL